MHVVSVESVLCDIAIIVSYHGAVLDSIILIGNSFQSLTVLG